MKKQCLVIRHGALGDGLMVSCALPYLAKDYDITFLGNNRAKEVLANNPYIKEWIHFEDGVIPIQDLPDYYASFEDKYDKIVTFSGVVEGDFLHPYPSPNYYKTMRQRREMVKGKNYFDAHLKRAGVKKNGTPPNVEVYFSKEETRKGKEWKRRRKNEFSFVWALAGSSNHKIYRYFEQVTREFLDSHPNAVMYASGDYPTKLLTYEHPQVKNMMMVEDFSFRDAMLLAKYSDLVIGPETGLLVAASGFKVPKIILLSHAGPEALTKYWINTHAIQAPCWCSPCYLLFKYKYIWLNTCQIDDRFGMYTPKCTEHGQADILEKMEKVYNEWKNKIRP